MDDGEWQVAQGSESWTAVIPTEGLKGTHTVWARAFDGTNYGPETSRTFVVEEETVFYGGQAGEGIPLSLLAVPLVIALAALVLWRRHGAL